MDPKLRIVTQLPLRGLWTDTGPLSAHRLRALGSDAIRELLRLGPVQFVVVDVGRKPRWIDLEDCYRFWLEEVKHHLAEPETKVANDYVYFYYASEWQSEEMNQPIVVVELRH